ncbi:uncharacterized protein ACIQIH_004456 [Cyanocitta cristata]
MIHTKTEDKRVQTGKFSLFIHSLYFGIKYSLFLFQRRVCLIGNTTVASRQHLANLVAATRNTLSLQLVKGKKKKPLQNLKILEYILQFPGLYAASYGSRVGVVMKPTGNGCC